MGAAAVAGAGVFFGGVFCATDALGLAGVAGVAGVDGDLGMEVVLGGTCFAEAATTFAPLGGVASLATFAATLADLGVAGLVDERGEDAGLEAEGIEREPCMVGLEMLTLLSEPIFLGAIFGVCVEAVCGFLEGIP